MRAKGGSGWTEVGAGTRCGQGRRDCPARSSADRTAGRPTRRQLRTSQRRAVAGGEALPLSASFAGLDTLKRPPVNAPAARSQTWRNPLARWQLWSSRGGGCRRVHTRARVVIQTVEIRVRRTYADLDNATVEGVWRTDLTPALRSRRSITALMLAVDRNAVSPRHSASCSGGVFERCSISRRTPAASDRVRFAVSADELF